MAISDEVASKPGGAALAELLRKVENSQPDAIRQIGQRWRKAADATGDSGQQISRAVNGVHGAWQGSSAEAFVGYMGTLTGAFDKAKQAVETSAGALDQAAQVVETAKNAVNAIGERALADAKKAEDACTKTVSEHNDDAEAQQQATRARDSAIEQTMQQHAQEAQTKIAEANEGLGGALGALSSSSSGLADAFSKIPKGNDQGFAPAPGRPMDWKFTSPSGAAPATTPGGTAPAAAEPPAAGTPTETGSGGASAGHHGQGSGGSPGYSGGGPGGSDGSAESDGSGGLGSSGGPPSGGPPPGNVNQWIQQAIQVLQANGVPVNDSNIKQIWAIIQHESGGNPHAINLTDSNAQAGHPSKGLMQCIDSTFQSNKLPGHDDIYSPVDNIIAGVKYAIGRYGSLDNVPGLKSMEHGGNYQGY
jgi:WXG100 family type VII secretion target